MEKSCHVNFCWPFHTNVVLVFLVGDQGGIMDRRDSRSGARRKGPEEKAASMVPQELEAAVRNRLYQPSVRRELEPTGILVPKVRRLAPSASSTAVLPQKLHHLKVQPLSQSKSTSALSEEVRTSDVAKWYTHT